MLVYNKKNFYDTMREPWLESLIRGVSAFLSQAYFLSFQIPHFLQLEHFPPDREGKLWLQFTSIFYSTHHYRIVIQLTSD